MFENFIQKSIWQDSYKYSHFLLYPDNLKSVTSYIEPRGPAGADVLWGGFQWLAKTVLNKPVTKQGVDYLKSYIVPHGLPFNEKGFDDLINKKGGYWPVEIQALAEGTVHQTGVPQLQTTCTDDDFAWVPGFLETTILRDSGWYCSGVGTISWSIKQIIKQFLAETSDDPSAINFMLHDFGFRAASSFESGMIGGFGHLINFMGTDTTSSLIVAREGYGEHIAGFSVIASEHSIATIWGPRREGEYLDKILDALENAPESNPFPIGSIVADSYDLWHFVDVVVRSRAERIKKLRGRLVIRPDSGDPRTVPVKVIKMLMEIFGYVTNSKGYKVLPPFIRVIQGDGINRESIREILQNMKKDLLAADNIVFGMGGKLLGAPQRDDLKVALKVNSATLDDEVIDVYKNPITDPGKASKAGRQAVVNENGKLMAVEEARLGNRENFLVPTWRDGELLIDRKMTEIRERSNA